MILRKLIKEKGADAYPILIGWGQAAFLLGIFCSALADGRYFSYLLGGAALPDIAQGLLAGMAGILIGLSIVLNIRGLMLRRGR